MSGEKMAGIAPRILVQIRKPNHRDRDLPIRQILNAPPLPSLLHLLADFSALANLF